MYIYHYVRQASFTFNILFQCTPLNKVRPRSHFSNNVSQMYEKEVYKHCQGGKSTLVCSSKETLASQIIVLRSKHTH